MNIIKLSAIDSTNSYLKELVKEMSVNDETIVWASQQKKGRGQQQTVWESQPGKSLTFSVYKRFSDIHASEQFKIAMAVSLGLKRGLDELGVPCVTIKWPNDIMSYTKKCCGILIENEMRGVNVTASIIGIGLNVNESQFENLPNATSLMQSTGSAFDLEKVFNVIVMCVLDELKNISKPLAHFKNRFEKALFGYQEQRAFIKANGTHFFGNINGITTLGELQIVTQEGIALKFQNKEIRFVL